MNVRLAAQLSSDTTSMSFKYFGQQNLLESQIWHTSEFIRLVDSWFDHCNLKPQ